MIAWCKRCFGIRTIEQRMKEELMYAQFEVYNLQKNMHHDSQLIKFYNQRISHLQNALNKEAK